MTQPGDWEHRSRKRWADARGSRWVFIASCMLVVALSLRALFAEDGTLGDVGWSLLAALASFCNWQYRSTRASARNESRFG